MGRPDRMGSLSQRLASSIPEHACLDLLAGAARELADGVVGGVSFGSAGGGVAVVSGPPATSGTSSMTSSKIGSGRSMSFSCRSPSGASSTPSARSPATIARVVSESEHLPAGAGGRDPRGPHDVEPGVALVADRGLAGMQPEAHAHPTLAGPRARACARVHLDAARDRLARPDERVEERVALGIDLLALVRGEDLAHQPPMHRQQLSRTHRRRAA